MLPVLGEESPIIHTTSLYSKQSTNYNMMNKSQEGLSS